jgi:hypothetical protein
MFDANNYSHGPVVKFLFDIKNTDIGFCLYAKWKFNHEDDHSYQSVPFGARVSFSRDFFSLFFGVGSEPRFVDERENVVTIYTGLTVYFPMGMTLGGLVE